MRENSLYQRVENKAIREKIPLKCHFDLTYQCNLCGPHCYIVREERPELATVEVKDILDQLAEAGTLFLNFSGGEIFLRDDFFFIAEYARKRNFVLQLLTNGTLIDDAAADDIAALRPMSVKISIYSTTPEIHDEMTGTTGSFVRSLEAVKRLREREVPVKLSCLIMEKNFSEYRKVCALARKLGCGFQADPHVTPKINGDTFPMKFHVSENRLAQILADPLLNSSREMDIAELRSNREFGGIPCLAAHITCNISPYGDVFPCVQFPLWCGNLRENAFKDIWRDSPGMLRVREADVSKMPVCSRCDLLPYCRRCTGLAWMMKNDDSASYEMACREADIMKKIQSREVGNGASKKTDSAGFTN